MKPRRVQRGAAQGQRRARNGNTEKVNQQSALASIGASAGRRGAGLQQASRRLNFGQITSGEFAQATAAKVSARNANGHANGRTGAGNSENQEQQAGRLPELPGDLSGPGGQRSEHTCAGCEKRICDRFLLNACNKYWHQSCLKCDRCQAKLGELGTTLYEKGNMNLCRQDYIEMFGQKAICSICDKLIYASEMVMRAKQNVYHLECFACQLCGLRFCVGDRFHLFENKIVCQYDYDEHILPLAESMQMGQQHQQQPHIQAAAAAADSTGELGELTLARDQPGDFAGGHHCAIAQEPEGELSVGATFSNNNNSNNNHDHDQGAAAAAAASRAVGGAQPLAQPIEGDAPQAAPTSPPAEARHSLDADHLGENDLPGRVSCDAAAAAVMVVVAVKAEQEQVEKSGAESGAQTGVELQANGLDTSATDAAKPGRQCAGPGVAVVAAAESGGAGGDR